MDRDSAKKKGFLVVTTKICLTLPKRKLQLSQTYPKPIGKSWKISQVLVLLTVPSWWTMTIRNVMVSKTPRNHQPTLCFKQPNYTNSVTPCWCGGIDVARHIQIAWDVRKSRVKILENVEFLPELRDGLWILDSVRIWTTTKSYQIKKLGYLKDLQSIFQYSYFIHVF